jgi:hypothetical protein
MEGGDGRITVQGQPGQKKLVSLYLKNKPGVVVQARYGGTCLYSLRQESKVRGLCFKATPGKKRDYLKQTKAKKVVE